MRRAPGASLAPLARAAPLGSALLAFAAIAGCESRLTLGGGCTFTSECAEPNVCAGGRCRAECREDRDCAGSSDLCTRFGGAGGVCTPPSTPVPCQVHSDCGGGARCEAGTCRADCRTDMDCLGLGTCAAGVCTTPITTPPAPGDGGGLGECVGSDRMRCHEELVCRDLATDPANCGACGLVCETGACHETFCTPANDTCENAELIDLASGSARLARAGLGGATDSPGSCSPGIDVFYRFRLDERRLVWAVVDHDSTYVVNVGLHEACGTAPSGCVALYVGDVMTRSEALSVLDPGDHWLSVDLSATSPRGPRDAAVTLRIYTIAVGSGAVTELSFDVTGVLNADTFSGSTIGQTSSPASCATGPDVAYFFRLLPGELPGGRSYTASTCGSGAFDSALSLVRADGGASLCAGADECGTHGALRFTLSPGTDPEGLYALFVDGATAADEGDFSLTLSIDP